MTPAPKPRRTGLGSVLICDFGLKSRMSEIWKPVLGYEGLYEVSNLGRVRSYHESTRRRRAPFHYLSPGNVRGYRQLILCKDGEKRVGLVHRLVAEAFLGPAPIGTPQINHRDFNKSNNRPENLEWVTQTENNRYSAAVIPRNRGETNHSKLTETQVREMRRRYAAGGVTQQQLADELGVSNVTCNLIIRRIKWRHVA